MVNKKFRNMQDYCKTATNKLFYYTMINVYKVRWGKGKGCQATRFFLWHSRKRV